MAILNPAHLIEQAERLIQPPPNGPPRQVDVRRAISAAYYAVFHTVVAAAADQYVGKSLRSTPRYGLVYRSVDHRRLKELCSELTKAKPPKRYEQYLPSSGMDTFFVAFATAVADLQERRHVADYDPIVRLKTENALAAVNTAKSALQRFDRMDAGSKETFLSLLVFYPRQ